LDWRRCFLLHDEIRRLRTAHGFSQVELADRLGVSKQSVPNWENNNIQPSVEMLERLADAFHVTTDELLGRAAAAQLDVSGLTERQVAHLRALAEDLRALPAPPRKGAPE